jgi:hypothetical protein
MAWLAGLVVAATSAIGVANGQTNPNFKALLACLSEGKDSGQFQRTFDVRDFSRPLPQNDIMIGCQGAPAEALFRALDLSTQQFISAATGNVNRSGGNVTCNRASDAKYSCTITIPATLRIVDSMR